MGMKPKLMGIKQGMMQVFDAQGNRISCTVIHAEKHVISQIKTKDKDGYDAIQVGFGSNMKADKPTQGHSKKAGLKITPRFFMESKAEKIEEVELGSAVNVEEILAPGDIIDVIGTSKGKGFAGVVKRHHFKGGPKTHGQSDRHRAPGSIGQSTTPGRVYKGKRMAGRMGNARVTLKNLLVMDIVDGTILLKGLIPGPKGTLVTVVKKGEKKKFVPLYSEKVEEVVIDEAKVEEVGLSNEEQEALRVEVEAAKEAEELAAKEAAQLTPKEEQNVAPEEVVEEKKEAVEVVEEKEEEAK